VSSSKGHFCSLFTPLQRQVWMLPGAKGFHLETAFEIPQNIGSAAHLTN